MEIDTRIKKSNMGCRIQNFKLEIDIKKIEITDVDTSNRLYFSETRPLGKLEELRFRVFKI